LKKSKKRKPKQVAPTVIQRILYQISITLREIDRICQVSLFQ